MIKKNSEGIVLKYKNFSEADRIYTIFTKDEGKISAIAKGVRKISSKRSGNLEILNHIKFSTTKGSGIALITEVASLDTYSKAREDFEDVKVCFCIAELIDKFMQEEEQNAQVFDLALTVLDRLGKTSEAGRRLLLLYFQYNLLYMLGFDPQELYIDPKLIKFLKELKTTEFNEIFKLSISKDNFVSLETSLKDYVEDTLETPLKSMKVFAEK